MVTRVDGKAGSNHPMVLTAHLYQGGTEPTVPPQPPTADPAVPPVPHPASTGTTA